MSVFPNGSQNPKLNPDEQGVSIILRLPQKSIVVLLGFCLSFGFGFVVATSQSQAQTQKQSQSQSQVASCNVEQQTTKTPVMSLPSKNE
ncbi:MAG: hypothetical protein F6J96_31325 [Symploca sp. SIO1C2]|nr:hypothetical protein [Symploca sp. SIO1C2]NER49499.1 hypothetical protein [Symploca sp. SIO1A3]